MDSIQFPKITLLKYAFLLYTLYEVKEGHPWSSITTKVLIRLVMIQQSIFQALPCIKRNRNLLNRSIKMF